MKGKTRSAAVRRWHDAVASLGCIACMKMGIATPGVSIHHIDGRTKPWSHYYVLPLCGPHHQDHGIPGIYPVHPWKPRFEAEYGTQRKLFLRVCEILQQQGGTEAWQRIIKAGV